MAQALKVTSTRVEEMQKDPQAYFRKARAAARKRAAAQLKAEQEQRAKRNYQAHNKRINVQAGANVSVNYR